MPRAGADMLLNVCVSRRHGQGSIFAPTEDSGGKGGGTSKNADTKHVSAPARGQKFTDRGYQLSPVCVSKMHMFNLKVTAASPRMVTERKIHRGAWETQTWKSMSAPAGGVTRSPLA